MKPNWEADDFGKIRRGDTVTDETGRKSIVVKIGRGIARSAILFREDGHWKICPEVDYWHERRVLWIIARKPANLKFAKEYCQNHDLPLV